MGEFMNVGHSIQYWLWQNDQTLNWFAEQLNVTRATASAWANDPRRGLVRIDDISHLCDTSIGEFLCLADKYDPDTMSARVRWENRNKV